MTKKEYLDAVEPVISVCPPVSDEALKAHYDQFKDIKPETFGKAVKEVLRTHEGGWFPLPAVFDRAIEEIGRNREESYSDEEYRSREWCPMCNNVGVTLADKEGYTVATPCACFEGMIWRRAWENLRDQDRQRRERYKERRPEIKDKRVEGLVKGFS